MFTIEDVSKIAKLSYLTLTPEEKATFAQQFSTILDYFKVLETVELPETRADRDESALNLYREDIAEVSPVAPEQFSPYVEHKCFKVPKVIDATA